MITIPFHQHVLRGKGNMKHNIPNNYFTCLQTNLLAICLVSTLSYSESVVSNIFQEGTGCSFNSLLNHEVSISSIIPLTSSQSLCILSSVGFLIPNSTPRNFQSLLKFLHVLKTALRSSIPVI